MSADPAAALPLAEQGVSLGPEMRQIELGSVLVWATH